MEFVPFWIVLTVCALAFLLYYKSRVPKKKKEVVDDGYVAIDIQGTGIVPGRDEMLQIGAVKYKDGDEIDRFMTYVRPRLAIPEKISETTGIIESDVAQAPKPYEAITKLIDFIQGYPLVGHNAAVDLRFINTYAPNYQPPAYDTLAMSRRVHNDIRNHDLISMKNLYGLQGNPDALGNALATGQLFKELLKETLAMGPEHRREIEPIQLETRLKENKAKENASEFSSENQEQMALLREIIPSPRLTFYKKGDDLHVVYFKDIAKISSHDPGYSILLPGRAELYRDSGLEALPPQRIDGGHSRLLFTKAEELRSLETDFQEILRDIDAEIVLLDREYFPTV